MAGNLDNQYDIYAVGFDKALMRGKIDDPEIQAPDDTVSQDPLSGSSSLAENGDFSGGLYNPVSGTTAPESIRSGEMPALIGHGKKKFTDTTAGFLMGVDSDKIYKWIIGDASSSADWAVTTPATLTIKGNLTADTGVIGGFDIGSDYIRDAANSFGLASTVTGGDDVRFWAGDTFANRASAPLRITESGKIVATSVSTQISSFSGTLNPVKFLTFGENISSGETVQMGGDYVALISQDSYTTKASPNTNFGNANPLHAGNWAVGTQDEIEMWFQFVTSTLPPSANISSAVFTFYVSALPGAGNHTLDLCKVTGAAWVENTITHNNKPAVSGTPFATSAVINAIGTYTIDITTQIKRWIDGTDSNYGFVLQDQNGSAEIDISSSEDGTNFPYILITFASGKVYKASATTLNATNRWLGICFTTTSSGGSGPVQLSQFYSGLTLTTDTPYYQSDTRGSLATSAGTVSRKVGLSINTTDLLILNT